MNVHIIRKVLSQSKGNKLKIKEENPSTRSTKILWKEHHSSSWIVKRFTMDFPHFFFFVFFCLFLLHKRLTYWHRLCSSFELKQEKKKNVYRKPQFHSYFTTYRYHHLTRMFVAFIFMVCDVSFVIWMENERNTTTKFNRFFIFF